MRGTRNRVVSCSVIGARNAPYEFGINLLRPSCRCLKSWSTRLRNPIGCCEVTCGFVPAAKFPSNHSHALRYGAALRLCRFYLGIDYLVEDRVAAHADLNKAALA